MIWKPVKDYEGLYEVNKWGKVRHSDTHELVKPIISKMKHNYIKVSLVKNEKANILRVYRLVAFAFLPNIRPEYEKVNTLFGEKKIKIKIVNDTYQGRKLKHKIGEIKEISEHLGLHLCKHGIAEEVVKEKKKAPDNKAEKFKEDTIKKKAGRTKKDKSKVINMVKK